MTSKDDFSRRQFIGASVAAASAISLGIDYMCETSYANGAGLPSRALGSTGVQVPILCLGGHHVGNPRDEKYAIRLIQRAVDEGITFIDSAWCYHNGRSEERQGKALAEGGRRQKVFLMTKVCARTWDGAMKQLEESLRRLKTDYVDLWQIHHVCHENSSDYAFEKGAVGAVIAAKQQGKTRYIGFTGHKRPWQLLKMLGRGVDFDTAEFPVNVLDTNYGSFIKEVLPECLKRNMGVLGMKSLAGGVIPQRAKTAPPVAECVRYALSQPISSLVVGIETMEHLEQMLEIGRSFEPMTAAEQSKFVAQVRGEAVTGGLEPYKRTHSWDTDYHVEHDGYNKRDAVRLEPPGG